MRIFGLFSIIFLFTFSAIAAVVNINVTGWSQGKKNMVTAMAVGILYSNGTTYDSINHDGNGNITVVNPVGSLSYLTAENITAKYDAWKILNDAIEAATAADEANKTAELLINDFSNVTMAQIDAKIDAAIDPITNIATAKTQLKIILKKIARYIKAKGL